MSSYRPVSPILDDGFDLPHLDAEDDPLYEEPEETTTPVLIPYKPF